MADGATILYIEDDDDSRVLVERILTRAGFRVLVAARALQGIDLAQQHEPDLILADINLPDLSGREIAIRLRANPRLADVPIVALTAYTDAADREKTLIAGVTGYLTKPIDPRTLLEEIAGYLRGVRDTVDQAAADLARQAYNRELVGRLEQTVRDLETSNRELRRLDAIKDDFIQLTAHELRTPLTTVYGYSRLVQTAPVFRAAVASDADAAAAL
ncbi:MAG: response regulator, partial [Anaerolineae bacterium]|nr:response regulator [Anaerolineae bacterium]